MGSSNAPSVVLNDQLHHEAPGLLEKWPISDPGQEMRKHSLEHLIPEGKEAP